ncbi:MAG TPA: gluconate 2-dehydrogenase subunit 3 family protein [Gemmatimonadaceae bacterium]
MPTISRRTFLGTLAATVPLAVFVRKAHAAAVAHLQSEPATLDALAEVVLPSTALGKAGVTRAAAAFRTWGAGYRESAELNHGYGTSRLRASGPTPLTRWAKQLDDLDAAARTAHQKRFRELSPSQRTAIVHAALQGKRFDRMPSVNDAEHVALALVAHFYESSAANDLCYQAQIGRSTCRKLSESSRKPLPMIKLSER